MFKAINTANPLIQDMLSYIKHECREREKRSASYYNFDFTNECPQEEQVRFEWTKISRHKCNYIKISSLELRNKHKSCPEKYDQKEGAASMLTTN